MTPASRTHRSRSWQDVLLVYRREVGARLASKGYFVGMAVMVAVVAALVVGLSAMGADKTFTVAACGAPQSEFGVTAKEVRVQACSGLDQAREQTDGKQVDAAVVVAGGRVSVLVRGNSDPQAQQAAVAMSRTWAMSRALEAQHVDRPGLEAALADAAPEIVTVGSSPPTKEVAAAVSLLVVLFMQIIGQGSLIAQGVVEEKSTRIVEVLLSTLTPLRLMTGKVAGIGTAAVLQIAVLVGAMAGAGAVTGGSSTSLPGTGAMLSLMVWFLLSFALFAGLFAAAGSLVSRPEELQSVLMPVMVLALVPVGVVAVAAGDLSAPWVGVLQYIPPFSGMLIPLQASVGTVSVTQQLLAAGVMLAATAGCMWLAARVYRASILKIGSTVRWRQALAA
ncbi:ABC transporter permease [Kitasatospora sp. NPDC056181]|uniref:ABC transporter permease n=1 Tax=Kitasatospora sp. NPDC056181 TaxID=3345737 RepID=UPI0035E24FC9